VFGGQEAALLRKGLFAIVLVAASFAGGAVVNGPGLRWVRDMVLNPPGAEIATTSLGDAPAGGNDGVAPVAEIPSTPIPPLVVPSGSSDPAPAPAPPRVAAAEPPRPRAPEPPRSPEPKPALPLPSPLPVPTPVPAEKAPAALALDSRDAGLSLAPVPEVKQPAAASLPIAVVSALEPQAGPPALKDRDTSPGRPPGAAAPVDPDVSVAVLGHDSGPPRLETHPEPAQAPAPAPSQPAAPGARGSDDWGTIQRKMKALGVARYGIEGEPDGRVRFHCVIPLAGRRAVGQQFEAEGNDAIEAAQTALRRVALWRATEHPPAAPAPSPTP
jgi:hypothetical protein